MKLYTSFFDNWRLLKLLNITAVSVTDSKPIGFSGIVVLSSLAPNNACKVAKKGEIIKTYWQEVLLKSNPYYVYKMLQTVSMANNNSDIALCDFLKPNDHNFRRQIALWLQRKLFIDVPELPDGTQKVDVQIKEEGCKEDLEEKENLRQAIIQEAALGVRANGQVLGRRLSKQMSGWNARQTLYTPPPKNKFQWDTRQNDQDAFIPPPL